MSETQRAFDVAVVGATGAVGEVLLSLLEQRRFPVRRLLPLASARSEGRSVRFAGADVPVEVARPEAFEGIDLAFFAATGELSRTLGPAAVERGAVVIDKSNTFRMDEGVPLVVPEVNAAALRGHRGLIACPNCTTIGVVMALAPLHREAGLQSVVITTLQAASGAGLPGLEELQAQSAALAAGRAPEHVAFPAQLAENVLPLCERFEADGYSTEEHKLRNELRKILDRPELSVSMTCVRVPVPVGHSASVLVETERPLSAERARHLLADFPGVRLVDDPAQNVFPTPMDAAGQDDVLVGRVRRDLESERLWLFQSSDNLRKGAALNALQIAEAL